MAVPAFSLRIREPRLRALIREVASHEGISQNELLEQAAEHEVIARGALIADDLAAAAAHLAALTEAAHDARVVASITTFAEGERDPEPLQARQIVRREDSASTSSNLVAVSAFSAGR